MIKKNKKSKMTIDKLAILTKAGFNSVNNKIDHVENLVDKLAASTLKGFESIETRMATKTDIENMATKTDIEGLKGQIQGVDKRIDDFVATRVKYEDHNKLKTRVDFIEKKLESKSK